MIIKTLKGDSKKEESKTTPEPNKTSPVTTLNADISQEDLEALQKRNQIMAKKNLAKQGSQIQKASSHEPGHDSDGRKSVPPWYLDHDSENEKEEVENEGKTEQGNQKSNINPNMRFSSPQLFPLSKMMSDIPLLELSNQKSSGISRQLSSGVKFPLVIGVYFYLSQS